MTSDDARTATTHVIRKAAIVLDGSGAPRTGLPAPPERVDTTPNAIGRRWAEQVGSNGDQRPAADATSIVEMPTAGDRESLRVTVAHVVHVRLTLG